MPNYKLKSKRITRRRVYKYISRFVQQYLEVVFVVFIFSCGTYFQDEFNVLIHQKSYFVDTSSCRIRYVDPFKDDNMLNYYTPMEPVNCSDYEPFVRALYNASNKQYVLHMDENIVKKYIIGPNSAKPLHKLNCSYREIVRAGSNTTIDYEFRVSSDISIYQNYPVPQRIDYIIVKCSLLISTEEVIVQHNALAFVQFKNRTSKTTNYREENRKKKPSVLLIGIDSLSRINFRRNMPKLFEYFNDNEWFELQGYTKVGLNTFPNIMALLTGYNLTMAYNKCKPWALGYMDQCDLIWKDFKKFKYHTAYAEDLLDYNTFNYNSKYGFKEQPTDYYLRPMMLAINKEWGLKIKNGIDDCLGPKHDFEYIYDFALEFAKRCSSEPIFGLFWSGSFSHNIFNAPSGMEQRILKYFKSFESEGILNDAIVIFLSDHGIRSGPLLLMSQGFIEQCSPMFFISLPQWFKNEHPQFVKALEVNRNRLTSTYDVHMTLKHILQLYEPGLQLPQAYSCTHCQSIFEIIPESRTCANASIPKEWCPCLIYKNVNPTDSTVLMVTNFTIDYINTYLAMEGYKAICSPLKLENIIKAEVEENNEFDNYRIQFRTHPQNALFQATAVYDPYLQKIKEIDGVRRQDAYAKYAVCVKNTAVEKYCICREIVKI